MKSINTLSKQNFFLIVGILFLSFFTNAQRRGGSNVNISVNINSRPEPPRAIHYYYYPDYNVYYDCYDNVFIGYHRGRWVRNISVDFNIDDVFYVNIDFNGRDPYCHNDYHRRTYCHREVVYVERPRGHAYGHYKKHKKWKHYRCDD